MKRGEFAGFYFKKYENTDVVIDFVETHEGDAYHNAEPYYCEVAGLSDGKVIYADDSVNCFVNNYRPGLDLWWSGEDWYYKADKLIPLEYGEEVA